MSTIFTEEQISWYHQLKPLVDKFGIRSYLDTPQERNLYRKINSEICDPIVTPKVAKTTIRRKHVGLYRWTTQELECITDLYLKYVRPQDEHDARATILQEFRKQFDTHSDDAVELTVRRMIRLDTHYPSDGMLGASYQYFEILNHKCPDRFVPPADVQ